MPNKWTRDPDPAARTRLICLPFAGGGTMEYRAWANAGKAPWLQILPIVLPGREGRLSEPAYKAMAPLVDALAQTLMPYLDRPYAIYGHSMGSWVALALAWKFRARGWRPPEHVIVSGRRAPHLPDPLSPLHVLSDANFVQGMQQRYQAIPPQLMANRELMELFLPAMRADLHLLETWQAPSEPPLDVPMSAWAGADDVHVKDHELLGWTAYSTRPVATKRWPGGHFYLKDRPAEVFDGVLATLGPR